MVKRKYTGAVFAGRAKQYKLRSVAGTKAAYKYNKRSTGRARLNARTGGFMGQELKFKDYNVNATSITNTTPASGEYDPPTTDCLNAVAQGDGEDERDGRKYVVKSLYVKGKVKCATSVATNATRVRIVIVHDKQTNKAQAPSEQVLENFSDMTMAYRNLQYNSRFTVLMDRVLTLDRVAGAGNGTTNTFPEVVREFNFYKEMNMPVTCAATSATISAISDNSLHLMAFTDATTANPQINYTARIRFVG
jgi:hypothetical protein